MNLTTDQAAARAITTQLILDERDRQLTLWGDQSGNTLPEWMTILMEETGELAEAAYETWFRRPHAKPERGGDEAIRREAIHVAAVAMAIAEATLRSSHRRDGQ